MDAMFRPVIAGGLSLVALRRAFGVALAQRRGTPVPRLTSEILLLAGILLLTHQVQGGLNFTTLVSFNGTNGATPMGTLVQTADGAIYGGTKDGGAYSAGTVFRMTSDGTLTTLVSFAQTNGQWPHGGVIQGSDGNFYGTTGFGGSSGNGTVFKMTPDGSLTTLFSFNGANGATPAAELVEGSDGNFYGATTGGGAYSNRFGFGYGTIFRVTPAGALTTWSTSMVPMAVHAGHRLLECRTEISMERRGSAVHLQTRSTAWAAAHFSK